MKAAACLIGLCLLGESSSFIYSTILSKFWKIFLFFIILSCDRKILILNTDFGWNFTSYFLNFMYLVSIFSIIFKFKNNLSLVSLFKFKILIFILFQLEFLRNFEIWFFLSFIQIFEIFIYSTFVFLSIENFSKWFLILKCG